MLRKIVHVNKAYWPEVGGIETVCRQYAILSKSLFDDVEVLTIGSKVGVGYPRFVKMDSDKRI